MKKNTLIFYGSLIAVSIIAIIVYGVIKQDILTPILSIACSALAASFMAIIIDFQNNRAEKKRIIKAREIYFRHIYDQIIFLIERILWFYERINDEKFDWSLSPEIYSSIKYWTYIGLNFNYKEQKISFEESITRIEDIGKKYDAYNFKDLHPEVKNKVTKMFSISAHSCNELLKALIIIQQDKLTLDINNYISQDDLDSIIKNINLAIQSMLSTSTNYSFATTGIICAAKKLRALGNYKNDVKIGLHGSFNLTDFN